MVVLVMRVVHQMTRKKGRCGERWQEQEGIKWPTERG